MITTTVFRAMGCKVEIQLEAPHVAERILSDMPERFEELEACLSRFRPESDLMRLNAQAGEWVEIGDVLLDNIHQAKHMARLTDGLFNPLVLPALVANGYDRSFEQITPSIHRAVEAVPDWRLIEMNFKTQQVRLPPGSAIDLGGIAKGWTAQLIAHELADWGPCLVNVGGDIALYGAPTDSSGWSVTIADPDNMDDLAALCLRDTTIVTSGIDYRRWTTDDGCKRHHIINPSTGEPSVTDVQTVTIIHPHAPTAEAYAKAVLLKGSEAGLQWLDTRWHAAGLVVRQDGAVLATSQFATYFQERTVS